MLKFFILSVLKAFHLRNVCKEYTHLVQTRKYLEISYV